MAYSQVSLTDSAAFAPMVQMGYGFHVPGGDLADRFGVNSSIGGAFLIKNKKGWIYGVDGAFLFGNDVKEDNVIDPISTSNNFVINQEGQYTDLVLFQRGWTVSGRFGRVLPLFQATPNSGLTVTAGVGLLEHKIRYQNQGVEAPQLEGDYKKGYDRLSNGLMLSEFIGYTYLGNRRLINFYAGIELTQAFTQNRRTVNFDTKEPDNLERTDLLYGIRLGWILPLYKAAPKEFYFD